MTHIIDSRIKTKKAFKEAVKTGEKVYLDDLSIFNPISGFLEDVMAEREEITVTNHPKRSWFARVRKSKRTGRIIVE